MRHKDYQNEIHAELRSPPRPDPPQLQTRFAPSSTRPCPICVKRLKQQIGLTHTKDPAATSLSRLPPQKSPSRPAA